MRQRSLLSKLLLLFLLPNIKRSAHQVINRRSSVFTSIYWNVRCRRGDYEVMSDWQKQTNKDAMSSSHIHLPDVKRMAVHHHRCLCSHKQGISLPLGVTKEYGWDGRTGHQQWWVEYGSLWYNTKLKVDHPSIDGRAGKVIAMRLSHPFEYWLNSSVSLDWRQIVDHRG